MSTSLPDSSNSIKYYSGHRGPIFGAEGKFDDFLRQYDPIHLKNGYWKFSTYDDGRRAFKHGYHNPEEVLKTQDAGDGDYDDVLLLLVPGELDTTNKTSLGTAAVHLQTIYNERKLLGKSFSFRGAVPVYPVSTDPRLLRYRLTRYGIQQGKLPNDLLMPAPPSPGMPPSQPSSPSEEVSATSTPINIPSRARSRVSPAKPVLLLSDFSPPEHDKTAQPSPLKPTPTAPASGQNTVRSSTPVADPPPVQAKGRSEFFEDLQRPLLAQHLRNGLSLDPPATDTDGMISAPAVHSTNDSETHQREYNHPGDNDEICGMDDNVFATNKYTVDTVNILFFAASTPEDMFHAHVASLQCMDCGLIRAHTSDCWINEIATNLKPVEDLTTSELDNLADQVKSFDPVPWTTHYGLPEQIVEDPDATLQGMAEVVRNLDTTAIDPDLEGLDDRSTLLIWLLKSIGEVEVLEGHHEQTNVEMPDP
ncbi:hypothetical protein E8E12_002132 [Didymella heteroderae]|uniref:Uncharacterized protein n=1 Tax=Didymella heteroderae TaxID=1769908 RepID=A0A9P4WPK4_9PLEO|nr:hypothetical protein E8E12_002132 [Didymella heteroderae]